ncbi:MAG: YncE family protein, partial [Candidatus Xenobia bacterium]
ASAAGSGEVVAIDTASLKIAGRVQVGQFPDGLAYVPGVRKLFVTDESGGADVVVDAATLRVRRRIELAPDVGNTQYDAATGMIYVAVGQTDELVAVDPKREQVTRRLHFNRGHGPHGVLIDGPHHRAWVACQENHRLLQVDLARWRVTGEQELDPDPDVLAFDPEPGILYVACESGVVDVFQMQKDALHSLGQERLPYAHTVSVDRRTHRVYLPLQNVDGKPILRIMQR